MRMRTKEDSSKDVKKTSYEGVSRGNIKKIAFALGVKVMTGHSATDIAQNVLQKLKDYSELWSTLGDEEQANARLIGYEPPAIRGGLQEATSDGEDLPEGVPVSGWMKTGRDEIQDAVNEQERRAKMRSVPKLFVRDGDTVTVDVLRDPETRDPGALCALNLHAVKTTSGWNYSVCSQGTRDKEGNPCRCAFCESNNKRLNRKSLRMIYMVVDRDEREGKDGKIYKDQVRFFETDTRLHKTLERLAQRGILDTNSIEIGRQGDKQAAWSVVPIGKSDSPDKTEEAKELRDKFEDFYRPPTYAEQKEIIADVPSSGVAEREAN